MVSEFAVPVRTPLRLKTRKDAQEMPGAGHPWKLLVVDDEESVHAVTRVALSGLRYRDRPVLLLSAFSAQQAFDILRQDADIAICLLDVVMESDDAGLKLVERIRKELGNQAVRIILRTGQPGQTPEQRIILDYDINDYKAKSELSAQRLFTSVVAALRSFETIVELQRHRNGLRRILEQSDALFTVYGIEEFASIVLEQLAGFLDCQPNGILCMQQETTLPTPASDSDLTVIASAGAYAHCKGCHLDADCRHLDMVQAMHAARTARSSYFGARVTVICLENKDVLTYVALQHDVFSVTDNDRELLGIFVKKMKLALQSVVWHEQLIAAEQAATTDFLTGLTNRRHLMHMGALLLAGTRRRKTSLTVAMVDIDHFKCINDTHGHQEGDVALKALAELLRRRFRQSDIVARHGGEEFCILVADSNLAHAVVLFEELRALVEAHGFVFAGARQQLTVSIGLAGSHEDESEDLLALIARADARLYKAKKQGRNCLVCA